MTEQQPEDEFQQCPETLEVESFRDPYQCALEKGHDGPHDSQGHAVTWSTTKTKPSSDNVLPGALPSDVLPCGHCGAEGGWWNLVMETGFSGAVQLDENLKVLGFVGSIMCRECGNMPMNQPRETGDATDEINKPTPTQFPRTRKSPS